MIKLLLIAIVSALFNEPDCKNIDYNNPAQMIPFNDVKYLKIADQVCGDNNECYEVIQIQDDIIDLGKDICGFIVNGILNDYYGEICGNKENSEFGYSCPYEISLSLTNCEKKNSNKFAIEYVSECGGGKIIKSCTSFGDLGCVFKFTGAKEVLKQICGRAVHTEFYRIVVKSLKTGEIRSVPLLKNEGDKFDGILVSNSSGEFFYKNSDFYYICDDKHPTTYSMVKQNQNNCVININAVNKIMAPMVLHRYPYIILPPTNLKYKFSNISLCKITYIDRDPACQCTHYCLTTIHTTNYPCMYGREVILCNETTRNMTETIISYGVDEWPEVKCFIYDIITPSNYDPSEDSKDTKDKSRKLLDFLKKNKYWFIFIGVIILGIICLILFVIIFITIISIVIMSLNVFKSKHKESEE